MDERLDWLHELSDDGTVKLIGLLRKFLDIDQLQDYEAYFPQAKFHKAGAKYRNRMLSAGNQQGKTYSAGAEMAMHLTGEYPSWWAGKRFTEPILAWAAGQNGPATRDNVQNRLLGKTGQFGTGIIPKRCLVLEMSGRDKTTTGLFDFVYVRHKSGGLSLLRQRTYEQKREAWQGPKVDVVWFDEEPPLGLYEEGLARTIASKGITMMTFTPLLGYTDVVNMYMRDPEPDKSGRHWTRMTLDDAEHMSEEEKQAEIARWPKHQRQARIEGMPLMGVGQVFSFGAEDISCTPFEIPDWWPVIAGLDVASASKSPRAHPTAAVKIARDPDNDILYVTREYRKQGRTPDENWMALKHWGRIKWAWPKDAMAEKGTGGQIIKLYKTEGMDILPVHAQFAVSKSKRKNDNQQQNTGSTVSLERGIAEMEMRFEGRRLIIFSNLTLLIEEILQYHRDDKFKIVPIRDDLVDALRYAMMMVRFAKPEDDSFSRNTGEAIEIDPIIGF